MPISLIVPINVQKVLLSKSCLKTRSPSFVYDFEGGGGGDDKKSLRTDNYGRRETDLGLLASVLFIEFDGAEEI